MELDFRCTHFSSRLELNATSIGGRGMWVPYTRYVGNFSPDRVSKLFPESNSPARQMSPKRRARVAPTARTHVISRINNTRTIHESCRFVLAAPFPRVITHDVKPTYIHHACHPPDDIYHNARRVVDGDSYEI